MGSSRRTNRNTSDTISDWLIGSTDSLLLVLHPPPSSPSSSSAFSLSLFLSRSFFSRSHSLDASHLSKLIRHSFVLDRGISCLSLFISFSFFFNDHVDDDLLFFSSLRSKTFESIWRYQCRTSDRWSIDIFTPCFIIKKGKGKRIADIHIHAYKYPKRVVAHVAVINNLMSIISIYLSHSTNPMTTDELLLCASRLLFSFPSSSTSIRMANARETFSCGKTNARGEEREEEEDEEEGPWHDAGLFLLKVTLATTISLSLLFSFILLLLSSCSV